MYRSLIVAFLSILVSTNLHHGSDLILDVKTYNGSLIQSMHHGGNTRINLSTMVLSAYPTNSVSQRYRKQLVERRAGPKTQHPVPTYL